MGKRRTDKSTLDYWPGLWTGSRLSGSAWYQEERIGNSGCWPECLVDTPKNCNGSDPLSPIRASWCAAAEMQSFDQASAVEHFRLHDNFLVKVPQVAIHSLSIVCNVFIARTVVANRFAVRNVHVKRPCPIAQSVRTGIDRN